MKNLVTACLVIAGFMIFSNTVFAGPDQQDLSREKKLFQNYTGMGSTSVGSFCMEGHVFVLVTGNLSNSTYIIQVYEERNGKTMPKRCE